MRIAFVIPSLGPGGAERVATLLCGQWVRQGHEVTLATFQPDGSKPFFELDPRVHLRQIAAVNYTRKTIGIMRTNVARIRLLRSLFVDLSPEVIVAFMTEANVLALCASRGLGIPTVVSERNQPDRPELGRLRRLACRISYRWSDGIVVQTDEIAAWARRRFRVPVEVLPNPVLLERDLQSLRNPNAARQIVAAGRLVPQKGFDILIDSFSRLAGRHSGWHLTIYGEGPMRSPLEAAIRARDLQGRVKLAGLCEDIQLALRQASIFVLPSRFEGYPNILLEALACGCPVIATDCPGGCKAILAHGRYGVLVPPEDVDRLAAALESMMQNRAARERYALLGPEAVKGLNVATISEKWIFLFRQLQDLGPGPNWPTFRVSREST